MPLLIPEEKRKIPWFPIAVTLFVIAAVTVGVFYLFFAPTPGFEVIVPAPLQGANQLSIIEVDPTTVINSKGFRTLRSYTGLLGVGSVGRANPFLPL